MKILIALASFAAATTLVPERTAHAIAACAGHAGWAGGGTVIPPKAHLVYWSDRGMATPPALVAKINGKVVTTKVTRRTAGVYTFLDVTIESSATGALTLAWDQDKWGYFEKAAFTVKAKPVYPKQAKATSSRYHGKIPHSTVREVNDGLALKVNAPAVTARVKLRRDSKAAWTELEMPVVDSTIKIGELGCTSNYVPSILEGGVDIEVTLVLPDATTIPVADLTRVSIPKLAKPSSNEPSAPY